MLGASVLPDIEVSIWERVANCSGVAAKLDAPLGSGLTQYNSEIGFETMAGTYADGAG